MQLVPFLPLLLLYGAAPAPASAEDGSTTSTVTKNPLLTIDGTVGIGDATLPTGTYLSYSVTLTLSNTNQLKAPSTDLAGSITGTSTENLTIAAATSTSESLTVLSGSNATTTMSATNATSNSTTASATSTTTPVINTRPCNGYVEFCSRNYSNITVVAAHNSPFVKPANIAANQVLPVLNQLNDGIRMLQMQTHYLNNTLFLCHTSCDLLNMGPLEDYLTTVAGWLKQNPYDVLTILIGNGDYVDPGNFTAPIENSGLKDLVYTPPKIPMALDDWPTLSSMILTGKRAVVFLDYQANQTKIPWLMDEFSQLWETPFSPTDRAFPCTVQRPPNLAPHDAVNRLYMANHNLNIHVNLNLGNVDLLIPDIGQLDQTNNVTGYGSLGSMAENCTRTWNRPPNFLLVDYYNYGDPNGTVFEVAAKMNNVTYNGKCCGTVSAAPNLIPEQSAMTMLLMAVLVHIFTKLF